MTSALRPRRGIQTDHRGTVAECPYDPNQRGHLLVDVAPERAACEWGYVDTVPHASSVETFGVAFQVAHGTNRLAPAATTVPGDDAPPLAPAADDD